MLVLRQFESALVYLPQILCKHELHQVVFEDLQLKVYLPVIIGKDRDAILKLESIGISCIIHQDHILGVSIYNPQILDIHPLGAQVAVLTVQPMVNPLPVRIKIVDHHIRITRVTCSE